MSIPQLVVVAGWATWDAAYLPTTLNALGVMVLIVTLGVMIYAWRAGWPRWTATWYLLFMILAFSPLMLLSSYFEDSSLMADVFSELLAALILPLIIACVLYLVVRHDPIKALLAVTPIVVLIWQPNMEFVPDQIEAPINITSLFLAGLTTVTLIRWVQWRPGLWLVVLLNAVVGMMFAYAGIYHGGTLPYVAPGPSFMEVLKNFIPQFLAVSTIILGPFLAASFRCIGRNSGTKGNYGYHLVLLGMLLVLAGSLANFFIVWDDRLFIYKQTLEFWFTLTFILGLICYVAGTILLGQAAVQRNNLLGWLDYALLVIQTIYLPIVLLMPVIDMFSHKKDPLLLFDNISSQSPILLNALGLAWLFLTVWLITNRRREGAEVSQAVEGTTRSHA
jgi:hypothetical protein